MSRSSTETCWTCRVRKKKCDRKRPTCSACHSLDITCYNGNNRPSWVDNDLERDQFADRIKAQIKEKAECRREKSYIKVLPLGRVRKPKMDSTAAGRVVKKSQPKHNIQAQEGALTELSCYGCSKIGLSPAGSGQSESLSDNPALLGISNDIDTDLEITFLDYVFPFLFPFYRPSIFKGGRGWLLATLRKSMPLFHTAMGFSTYFFILIMTDIANGEHEVCKGLVEGKLIAHVDTAIKAMKQGIEDLAACGELASAEEKAHLMEGVVQLLVFETNISATNEWGIHLNAAVSLFKEIFEQYGPQDGGMDLDSVLDGMRKTGWSAVSSSHRIFNPAQGAFMFYAAVIIFADIISATILGDAPMLRDYHSLLINDGCEPADSRRLLLDLEDSVGCKSWILLLIADIASLVEGKKQGRVFRDDLLVEGNRIAEKLQHGITNLKNNPGKPVAKMGSFQAYSNPEAISQTIDPTSYSLIWAHATVLYLFVTTSGWQEQHQIIQENVASAIQLLDKTYSPGILRSLAWPFCVVGCLASTDQEETFRRIASRMGNLSAFGTLFEALRIMEQVWLTRGGRDVENWDFTYCFRILSSIPLLI
ncbi:transcriptional regulator family: Fungal Specific TF [Trichoderma aggressivum f. europaeum]|uniref:Transcriptional regulator family: Fungal Specific TF n=1 Tax=Trichoderma aggressivum f. europaeum TaxID=173218 RepID=A0AAE1IE83_9HYPO|nr:transcriptional regulator family: Fungal Specific TF [Trichoderma aggressivum f. europaeum]